MINADAAEEAFWPTRFSELPARHTLTAGEAVDLVLAAVVACNQAIPGVEGLPLPGADRILLHSDGRVTVEAPAAPGDDRQRMLAVATLLRDLLSLESPSAAGQRQVPGPLLMLLARAFGTIDLPAPSFEGLCHALARFGSASPHQAPGGDFYASPASSISQTSAMGAVAEPTLADSASERRKQPADVAALRRELQLRDRELFEAQVGRPRLRGAAVGVAIMLAALAVPAAALLTQGAIELLDHRAAIAREPSVTRQTPPLPPVTRPARPSGQPVAMAAPAATRSQSPGAASLPTVETSRPVAQTSLMRGDAVPAPPVATAPVVLRTALTGAPRPLFELNGGADLFSPSFGPSGEVLFHRGREHGALMRVAFDADGAARLTTVVADAAANYHAVLSPDGARLAYDSDRDGIRGVYVAERDGRNPVRVSGDGFAAVPRWSPDGRRLAFVRSEPVRPRVWNVWIVDLDSGRQTRVSRHTAGQAWSASWFPDGQKVAYTVESRLVIADLKTGATQIIPTPVRGALLRTPAVSPGGDVVAFQVFRDGVWLFHVAERSMRRLVADPSAEEFSWSPDGARLAYHSRRGGRWSLWQLGVF